MRGPQISPSGRQASCLCAGASLRVLLLGNVRTPPQARKPPAGAHGHARQHTDNGRGSGIPPHPTPQRALGKTHLAVVDRECSSAHEA